MAPSLFGWKPFSKKKPKPQVPQTPSSASLDHPKTLGPPPPTAHLPPKIDDPQVNPDPPENVDPLEIAYIRSECPQITILVTGRANSGKTTIIQRMCDTNEEPMVHDKNGIEYPASVLTNPGALRGIHNIRLQITFKSNPNFRFHDSMGFESGSVDEVQIVKDFINEMLAETELRNRLHMIWYCVPTDSDRVASKAELSFFQQSTGDIPVIVVFTKWDGQIIKACNTLRRREHMDIIQAKQEAPARARKVLEEEYIPVFKNTPHPPVSYTVLGYMDRPETKCSELAEKTAAALTNGVLKKLFVSVQTHNLELCIRGGINEALSKTIFSSSLRRDLNGKHIISVVLSWFSHIFWNYDYSYEERRRQGVVVLQIIKLFEIVLSRSEQAFPQPLLQAFNNVASAAIVATRSFDVEKRTGSVHDAIKASIEEYLASLQCQAVKTEIASKFNQHAEIPTSDLLEETRQEISEELVQICLNNLLR